MRKKITVTMTIDPDVWIMGQDCLLTMKKEGKKKFRGMSNYVEYLIRKDLKMPEENNIKIVKKK